MLYSDDIVQRVREKARATSDRDVNEWRKDECGARIERAHYSSSTAEFGWKIQNVEPGGLNELDNLRAFHRDNAFGRGTGKPHCMVTADR